MSKRGVHGSPRSGAALAPYKHFAEQYLGAGAIHLPRACRIRPGVPAEGGAFRGAGKKKLRSLGTVPIPTEAFMAVWKLDEE